MVQYFTICLIFNSEFGNLLTIKNVFEFHYGTYGELSSIMKVLLGVLFKKIYGNTHPQEGYCQEFRILPVTYNLTENLS